MRQRIGVAGWLAALVLAGSAWQAPPAPVGPAPGAPLPHPRGYVCYRAAAAPVVDGRLDDPCWRAAAWTEAFIDIEGDRKPAPRFLTRAKMAWDDEYFYIAAEMEEPHVWATLLEHDAVIFRDHDFEVFLDPDGDNHNYFEFEINAHNTGWDLFLPRPYKDGGSADNSWEIPALRTAVHIDGTLNDPSDTDRGWTVEMAFPWRAFARSPAAALPPAEGARWRVNFSRVEWRLEVREGRYHKVPGVAEDNWVWSPQHVVNMHRPETWGYVEFRSDKPGTRAFAPDPLWDVKQELHARYYARRGGRKPFLLRLAPCEIHQSALLRCAPGAGR